MLNLLKNPQNTARIADAVHAAELVALSFSTKPHVHPSDELSGIADLARLLRSDVFRDRSAKGNNEPVILVPPAFLPDKTMSVMRNWLLRMGYSASFSGMGRNNIGSKLLLQKLEGTIDRVYSESGARKVTLIGHSLGAALAIVAANRHAGKVEQVIGLAPVSNGTIGMAPIMLIPVVFSEIANAVHHSSSIWEDIDALRELDGQMMMPYFSIFPNRDGVISRDTSVRHGTNCHNIKVEGSHGGMIFNPKAYRIILGLLRDGSADAV